MSTTVVQYGTRPYTQYKGQVQVRVRTYCRVSRPYQAKEKNNVFYQSTTLVQYNSSNSESIQKILFSFKQSNKILLGPTVLVPGTSGTRYLVQY